MGQHSRAPQAEESAAPLEQAEQAEEEPNGFGRRRFIGYLLAAPTLAVAAKVGMDTAEPEIASAAVPSPDQPSDVIDINDILTAATLPTANLISVTVNKDGTASFAVPRAESGQGITTSTAMMLAEELDLPVDKVHVTLADARPELVFNQATYASNTTISTYTPFRVAAAIARQQLLEAAAIELGDNVTNLTTKAGKVISNSGLNAIPYGDLAQKAATDTTRKVSTTLKDPSEFKVIGKPHTRIDVLEAVTGRKQYAMDLDVPNAWPTMICRAPTINGTVQAVHNAGQVQNMSGITDVVTIPTGVAVRGRTFGECIDAVRALKVSWGPGSVDGESDASIKRKLKAAELPLAVPKKLPVGAKAVEAEFTFSWKSNSALEPQTAVADVRDGKAEIWSSMQTPILVQERIAKNLGLAVHAVTCHVVQGGGAFGRRMFDNAPLEAAQISQKIGKPVKLMWHRADEFRYGRVHPMCRTHVRAHYLGGNVLSFEQRHTSVATDLTMGFGEIVDSEAAKLVPAGLGNLSLAQTYFETTANVPYNFGAVDQLLNEIYEYDTFHTGSTRNVYNPDVVTAMELVVDQLAKGMGKDPYEFRRAFVKDDRARAVLDKAAQAGNWGRAMPAGTAQGIALHTEYKGATAALVEIDARPQTVNRKASGTQRVADKTHDYTAFGPRVTKVVFVIDAGLPINPRGLEAQMMGGTMDAIAQTLTASEHLRSGNFLEGSWDQYFYTREWNAPLDLQVIVMPPTTGRPGGAGEFGVAASKAATAAALTRATGKMPTEFPINHNDPIPFEPYPRQPPIPPSPTDGLDYAY
jgi:isoquinoline 1-oxidoreductase beta subunit